MDPHFEEPTESHPSPISIEDILRVLELLKDPNLLGDRSDPTQYEKIRDLGEGISRVTEVMFKPMGKSFARKCYDLPDHKESCQKVKESLAHEVKLLKLFSGLDLFPEFRGSYEEWDDAHDKYTFNIVIDPVADRDLGRELRSAKVQFDPEMPPPQPDVPKQRQFRYLSRHWLAELSEVFFFLHGIGPDADRFVRHRDIKLANFLIVTRRPQPNYNHAGIPEPEEPPIKQIILSDFGISRVFPSITQAITNSTQSEKNFFSAPEVLSDGNPHGIWCDVFSLGAVMLEILAVMWNVPFLVEHTETWGCKTAYGKKLSELRFDIPSSSADLTWFQDLHEQEQKYFREVLAIIEKLMGRAPDERPTATGIHHYFETLEMGMENWVGGRSKRNLELAEQRRWWIDRIGVLGLLEEEGTGGEEQC